MPAWSGPVVYVHGAGEQENPVLMRRRLDGLLFGEPLGERSRLAYYAHLLHGGMPPGPVGLDEEVATLDPIVLAGTPGVPREELAFVLAGAGGGGPLGAADDGRTALAEALLARADAIEPPQDGGLGLEGIRFWDPGFRIIVGILARDVISYLFDGAAPALQEPVREALRGLAAPTLVIAHSLGTIIAYDVLTSPDYDGPAQVELLTVGCPLGIENVQDRLRNGAGQPNPYPSPVVNWTNCADPRDPVASGQPLTDQFEPHGRIHDNLTVENRSFLHHDLVEYLRVPAVRRVVGVP